MATTTFDMNDLKRRMQGAIGALKQELSGLRTGRASTKLKHTALICRSTSSLRSVCPNLDSSMSRFGIAPWFTLSRRRSRLPISV